MSESVTVNGREYRLPRQPTVVFAIDGGDPRYLDDALARGLMPSLASLLADGGSYARGLGCMPSLTNPNNLSIVTGVGPRGQRGATERPWLLAGDQHSRGDAARGSASVDGHRQGQAAPNAGRRRRAIGQRRVR